MPPDALSAPPVPFHRRAGRWLWGQPYLCLVATTLLWAGNAVASRIAIGNVAPLALTSLRWVIVISIMVPLLRRDLAVHAPALRARWRYLVIAGCLGLTAFNTLMYIAAHTTTAINIGIVQGAIPVFVLLGAWLAHGVRVGAVQVAGVTVTLLGVVLVAAQGDIVVLAHLAVSTGDLLMIVACLFYAGYTVALRDRPPVPGLVFFAALAVVAGLVSLPLALWEGLQPGARWPTPVGWLVVLYVALGPSLLAQLTFLRGVELIGPGRAGIFVNLVPVFAAVLAVLALGEPFRWFHAAALLLVLGGIALAERGRRRAG